MTDYQKARYVGFGVAITLGTIFTVLSIIVGAWEKPGVAMIACTILLVALCGLLGRAVEGALCALIDISILDEAEQAPPVPPGQYTAGSSAERVWKLSHPVHFDKEEE